MDRETIDRLTLTVVTQISQDKANSYNWVSDGGLMESINPDLFPSVKWEDEEPTEVEIIINPKGGEK